MWDFNNLNGTYDELFRQVKSSKHRQSIFVFMCELYAKQVLHQMEEMDAIFQEMEEK